MNFEWGAEILCNSLSWTKIIEAGFRYQLCKSALILSKRAILLLWHLDGPFLSPSIGASESEVTIRWRRKELQRSDLGPWHWGARLDKSRGIIPRRSEWERERGTDVSFFCQLRVWKISSIGRCRRVPSKQISGETSRNYWDHKLSSATKW